VPIGDMMYIANSMRTRSEPCGTLDVHVVKEERSEPTATYYDWPDVCMYVCMYVCIMHVCMYACVCCACVFEYTTSYKCKLKSELHVFASRSAAYSATG